MRPAFILIAACVLHAACAAPQFVTFKDGKIGVNFGGYHAEAGLGGLLTGNAAHGGLSASAGTPWGPKAAAGLGGGGTSGLVYAGAEASPSVGASAVLGGNAGEHGFIGSEAHANGRRSSNSISLGAQPQISLRSDPVTSAPPVPALVLDEPTDGIQKIRPPKKYQLIKNEDTHTSPSSIAAADSSAVSPISGHIDNPTVMINVHRQRMRERRRQLLEQEEALEQSERKRAIDQRARNRQRLHPRQRLITRTKSIDISVNGNGNASTESAASSIETRSTDSKQVVPPTEFMCRMPR